MREFALRSEDVYGAFCRTSNSDKGMATEEENIQRRKGQKGMREFTLRSREHTSCVLIRSGSAPDKSSGTLILFSSSIKVLLFLYNLRETQTDTLIPSEALHLSPLLKYLDDFLATSTWFDGRSLACLLDKSVTPSLIRRYINTVLSRNSSCIYQKMSCIWVCLAQRHFQIAFEGLSSSRYPVFQMAYPDLPEGSVGNSILGRLAGFLGGLSRFVITSVPCFPDSSSRFTDGFGR